MYSKLPPGYITKSTLITILGGTTVFMGYQIVAGKEKFHKNCLIPAVHRITDPETAHKLGVKLAKLGGKFPLWGTLYREYPELETEVFGMSFRNPIGLAAGFDKDGEAIVGLKKMGFGFVEVGSVTPLPQSGNPKPRVFRLTEDEAVINRYGFNSAGHGSVMTNVKKAAVPSRRGADVYLGVNLGKNKDSTDPNLDYSTGVIHFGPISDYIVINVSSPNTPGLRSMQTKRELQELLKTVTESRSRIIGSKVPKLLVKVAPDLTPEEKRDISVVCLNRKFGVDGLVVGNTTVSRPDTLRSPNAMEKGGLSGAPLKELSTNCIRDFYILTGGKVPIIGCGGVSNGRDAYEKIRAGASLVQLYTAVVYQGFPVLGRVKRELTECLKQDGFSKVSEAVGIDSKS